VSEYKAIQKDQRKSEAGQLELLVENERMAGEGLGWGTEVGVKRKRREREEKGGRTPRESQDGKGDPRWMKERTQTSERGFSCPLPVGGCTGNFSRTRGRKYSSWMFSLTCLVETNSALPNLGEE